MIESTRAILLPPPESAKPRSVAVAPWTAVEPVPATTPIPDATVETAGHRLRRMPDEDGVEPDRTRRDQDRPAALSGRSTGPFSDLPSGLRSLMSSAFLAQQIFQEAMTAGLHLEPWEQATGAYRRAGAAPPLASAAPSLVSLAV